MVLKELMKIFPRPPKINLHPQKPWHLPCSCQEREINDNSEYFFTTSFNLSSCRHSPASSPWCNWILVPHPSSSFRMSSDTTNNPPAFDSHIHFLSPFCSLMTSTKLPNTQRKTLTPHWSIRFIKPTIWIFSTKVKFQICNGPHVHDRILLYHSNPLFSNGKTLFFSLYNLIKKSIFAPSLSQISLSSVKQNLAVSNTSKALEINFMGKKVFISQEQTDDYIY